MPIKKKKICIILPVHWSYKMGGSEYQIKCLLNGRLLQKKFIIHILSRRLNPLHQSKGYHLIPIVRPYYVQRYGHIFDAPFLWQKLKKISPDVIYQNIGTSYAGIAACYAKRVDCKMVLHIASDNDIMPFNGRKTSASLIPYIEKKYFDYAIKNSSKLIAQTHQQKEIVRRYYRREVDAVIPNFQPYPKENIDKSYPIKVVWIANFKVLKQPEMFIQLAEDLSAINKRVQFIMAGKEDSDIRWQLSLEHKIKNIKNLSYLRGQTLSEINCLLSRSHILVNTSKYEGFSNTFIQAWMRKVPVVSLKSNPDNLLNGEKMGFVSESYEQLSKDVLRLIDDHVLREEMGNYARTYALQNFSMENAKCVFNLLAN